ncbi:sulfatase [Haloplanus rallus]|uniref:Sulfatase n=1 Tax=Haloplanus rallus TaxID=1816183 RepID=A0A6B9FAK2_9EURY|nr:sulfatase [Haloplanus rallus]QGX95604.1 sulfatase [Haloplanus rallus]
MSRDAPGNVLFVVMDTVRADHLTPYGYDRPTTPGLADFASEATVFEEAVAPAPWTLPVHASLFTGLYPSQHGADQENPYLEGATTLAETLSAAGYDTACYSSNAWITPYTHLTDGFDAQDNFFEVMPGDLLSGPLARAWKTMNDSDRLRTIADKLVSLGNVAHEYLAGGEGADSKTPAVIDRTMEFVDDSEDWFAFVNLMDAHLPYHPPDEFAAEFAPGVDDTAVCQNSKEYNSGARDIDDDEWDDIRGLYDAEIAHIDAQLTRLFDWLKERGEWDDTTVVVCADHGELHGEHDLYGHEFCLYDPLVNVPLMVKHPDLTADRRTDTIELVDLYHTVLDALDVAGGDPAAPGETAVARDPTRSLLADDYRAFDAVDDPDPGQAAAPDGAVGFVEYSRPVVELKQLEEKAAGAGIDIPEDSRFYARMRAARRPDAKYVRIDRIPDEAYRLDEDPGETEDRAAAVGDDPAVRAVERALADFEPAVGGAWTGAADADVTDDAVADMDEEAQERLRDLGYLE